MSFSTKLVPAGFGASMKRGFCSRSAAHTSRTGADQAGPSTLQRSYQAQARSTQAALGRRGFSSSSITQRNSPARRPRDPLDASPHAVRHALPSGETFIVRPPPTAGSHATTTLVPQPLLSPEAAPTSGPLPPPLRPTRPPAARTDLSAEEIAELRALRAEDPIQYTAGALAKRFGCSPAFVSIVAPLSKELRERGAKDQKGVAHAWGLNKRVAREGRKARRELW